MIPIMLPVFFLQFHMAISKVATDEMIDDAKLNFTELALKHGMSCEEYDVTTEDGYILKLFHVPGNKSRPILLTHGLLDTSDTFILRGHASIVHMLSKAGYDVWANNYRGNRYSRRHITLNPDTDAAFWNFSMHEHGLHDLSTSIDFVLNKTKASGLSYIGHSEGTVIMFILGSLRPEYNDKINIFLAWAPICYLNNVPAGIPFATGLTYMLLKVMDGLNMEEFLRHNSTAHVMIRDFCTRHAQICLHTTYFYNGYNPECIEPTYGPIVLAHFPAGTSKKNLKHFYQVISSRRFAQYDYGPMKNLVKYNSQKPPAYDLTKVTVKVGLFLAEKDNLSTQRDVRMLKKQLPNVVFYKVFQKLNHIDFPLGRYASKIIYPSVFRLLEKYSL